MSYISRPERQPLAFVIHIDSYLFKSFTGPCAVPEQPSSTVLPYGVMREECWVGRTERQLSRGRLCIEPQLTTSLR